MILDLKTFSANAVYHLLTQTVIPRPIAWVLSTNDDGQSHNLAPFSYFNAVCSDPPLLLFSCAPKADGSGAKDTVKNILRGTDFSIHIASQDYCQAVQDSATPLPYGESELTLTDLSLCDFADHIPVQRLVQAPVAFACRLYRSDTIGNTPQTLIFAEVKAIYIDNNAVTQQGKRLSIDAGVIAPLARLGQNQFMRFGDITIPATKK